MPTVTLADVARAAGVSLATASRALNGAAGRTVTPELRRRVLRAAAELRYSPNAHAQAMARGTSDTVGLIVADLADPSSAQVASGVMAAAEELGLIVTITSSGWDAGQEVRYVRALRAQRARAVILTGSRFADATAQRRLIAELTGLTNSGGAVAVVGQSRLPFPTLVLGNRSGGRALARVLWTLGYRGFAVLAGPETLLTSEERVAGFRDGLAESGYRLPPENVISTQLTRDGGYVAMTELLDREIAVETVFAVNDVMAVGAMAALREQGFHVPKDIAVAGFDDILPLRDIQPALTTVRLPLADIGRRALHLALTATPDAAPVVVPGEVVVRASTPDRSRP